MITDNIVYSVFPLIAVMLHLLIIKRASSRKASSSFIILFSIFCLLNAFQAGIYLSFDYSIFFAYHFTDAYLITAYFLFAALPMMAFSLSKHEYSFAKYIYIVPLVLTVLHFGGYMIDGYRVVNGTILHNDGVYSHFFDLFLAVSSIITVALLAYNLYTMTENLQKSRNLIALIAFVPFIFFVMLIIALSNTDSPISVVIIVPLVSVYISLVFYYVSGSMIIDLTIGPYAMWQRIKAAHMLLSTLQNKKDLDNFNRRVNTIKYQEMLARHNNNINKAAAELDIHHTTLRKALKEAEG